MSLIPLLSARPPPLLQSRGTSQYFHVESFGRCFVVHDSCFIGQFFLLFFVSEMCQDRPGERRGVSHAAKGHGRIPLRLGLCLHLSGVSPECPLPDGLIHNSPDSMESTQQIFKTRSAQFKRVVSEVRAVAWSVSGSSVSDPSLPPPLTTAAWSLLR